MSLCFCWFDSIVNVLLCRFNRAKDRAMDDRGVSEPRINGDMHEIATVQSQCCSVPFYTFASTKRPRSCWLIDMVADHRRATPRSQGVPVAYPKLRLGANGMFGISRGLLKGVQRQP